MQNYRRKDDAIVALTLPGLAGKPRRSLLLNPVLVIGLATMGLWGLILSAIVLTWS